MLPALRKFLLIVAACVIAAGITYYPWTYMARLTGAASSFYGMTSVVWAPVALVLGVAAGILFAYALWPRKPMPQLPISNSRDHSSFEA